MITPKSAGSAASAVSAKPSATVTGQTSAPTLDFRKLLRLVLHHRRLLLSANIIATLATLSIVLLPLLMPLLVDEVLLDQPGKIVSAIDSLTPAHWHGPLLYVGAVLGVSIFLRVAGWGFFAWYSLLFVQISKNVIYKIRRSLLLHLGGVAASEFENTGAGTVGARLVTDLETLDQFMSVAISRLLVCVLMIVFTAIILLLLHWQLAIYMLLLNPLVIYFTMTIGRRVRHLKKAENKAVEVFQQSITEVFSGLHQIRAANRDRHYFLGLVQLARKLRRRSANYNWKSEVYRKFSFLIFLLGFDVFRAGCILMVLFSDLTIGEMIASFGYLWFMLEPMQELLGMQFTFYAAKGALGRVNEVLCLDKEPKYPLIENPFSGQKTASLQVRNLCLSYDSKPVLNRLSMDIAAGEKIALVGASGGGKTTFVQLLLGLHEKESGSIAFGGIPIERIGYETIRKNVGCVLQQPALFNESIRDNITLGIRISDRRIWETLEIVQLAEFVQSRHDGLDTMVGLQGLRLSGGQQQRLAVARMLVTDPKLVILDEATSALDSQTETHLHEALFQHLQGRTVLLVAHRLNAVLQADRVLVFEDGQIIEQGKHSTLLSSKGIYSRLFSAQVKAQEQPSHNL